MGWCVGGREVQVPAVQDVLFVGLVDYRLRFYLPSPVSIAKGVDRFRDVADSWTNAGNHHCEATTIQRISQESRQRRVPVRNKLRLPIVRAKRVDHIAKSQKAKVDGDTFFPPVSNAVRPLDSLRASQINKLQL